MIILKVKSKPGEGLYLAQTANFLCKFIGWEKRFFFGSTKLFSTFAAGKSDTTSSR